MNTTRRELLSLGLGCGAAAVLSPLARAAALSPRKIVVVFADGAWDTTYCLDPKLGIPTVAGPEAHEDPSNPDDRESVETFSGLPIVVNDVKRPSVRRFFDLAGQDCVVVNGIAMGTISHDVAKVRMITGSPDPTRPDFSVIAGATHGAALPLGSVDTSGLSHAGNLAATSGRIGFRNQIQLLLEGSAGLPATGAFATSVPWAPTRDDADAVTALLRARSERFRQGRDLDPESAVRFAAWDQGFDRAERFRVDGAAVLGQLDVGGSPSLAKTAVIAADLLAGGLCHAVFTATPRVWDTHTDSTLQHTAYEDLFAGLEALYGSLNDVGLLDETLVVVMSEFNRTPLYNITGGKDHWPNGSAMLFGGGIAGGRVCGQSTDLIEAAPMDLETGEARTSGAACTYENFVAGVFEMLDVDPAEWLPGIAPFRGASPA